MKLLIIKVDKIKVMHISTANITKMVKDRANITIDGIATY